MDQPNKEDYNSWKWGFIYYNPDDRKIMVPKRTGLGWTFNFARPLAYVAIAALIGLIFLIRMAIKHYAG